MYLCSNCIIYYNTIKSICKGGKSYFNHFVIFYILSSLTELKRLAKINLIIMYKAVKMHM